MDELQKIANSLKVNRTIISVGEDDIVSEVILYLLQNQDIAEDIYRNKKRGFLYHLDKKEIFNQRGKMFFKNKMEFSWWQRVRDVCEAHNIDMRPENAYKISAILEETSPNFNISGVISLLSPDNPLNNGFTTKEGYLEQYKEYNESDLNTQEYNDVFEMGHNTAIKKKDRKQYKIYL